MQDNEFREYVTKKEFNIERDKTQEMILSIVQDVSSLKTLYATMSKLPETIQSLDKNMALMEQSISSINKEFQKLSEDRAREKIAQTEADKKQNKRIAEIDDKSKVDLMQWVRGKWFSIVELIAIVILFLKDYIAK